MGIIKDKIVKFILSLISQKWSNSLKMKILVSTNKYFTRNKWIKAFAKSNKCLNSDIEIIYCNNKYVFLKNFAKADACFTFGYNKAYENFKDSSKLIFIPTVGLDYLSSKTIPASFKIINPPPYFAEAIAEYCIAMAIVLTRNLQFSLFNQQMNTWDQQPILKESYLSLSKRKIGILGVGKVGKSIAKLFKAVKCTVYGLDLVTDYSNNYFDNLFELAEIEDFLKATDLLIISLPLTDDTIGMITIKELKFLGFDSYLINVSRGDIINENDLLLALSNNIIKGAVLDVFSKEPLKKSNKFFQLENVIITPHIAGNINLFVEDIQNDFIKHVFS